MPEENEPAESPPPEQSTLLGNIAPDEMLARGMQSVKMTSGATGTWQPPTMEECARLFPGYEVLRLLGRGGMGVVYQARQIELDRVVAIKLLPLEISVDKDFADRFRREARAMAKLNHPNIIAVYDFGTTREGHLFFVMEFVEGANLYDVIHQVGLDGDQSLSIVEQVCTALAYAHGKGIVHRDIKPANVMIDTESHVKVADFGLARLTDSSAMDLGHTMTGTVMGTPDYMAPEQMKGMNVDHRADIYSVGVMLYEMLCREVPKGIFDPPSHRTLCDARIDQIVIRSLQQAPDRRYQSTTEMKSDILAARHPVIVPDVEQVVRMSASPAKPSPLGPPKKPAPPRAAGAAAAKKPALPIAAKPAVMKAIPLPGAKKSKLPLYAGIGVAVAVAAFFLLKPKAEKLTQAQIYAREHAAGSTGRGLANPGALEPGAIKLWDAPEKLHRQEGVSWAQNALRLENAMVQNQTPESHDGLLRALLRMNADAQSVSLSLRGSGDKDPDSRYSVGVIPKDRQVQLHVYSNGRRMLQSWPFPRDYGEDQWIPLALEVVGDRLTVWFDGQVLGVVHDSTLTKPGKAQLYAKKNGYFRDIVYVPLDGRGGKSNAATPRLSPSSEPWLDAMNNANLLKVAVKEGPALRMTEACKRLSIDLSPEIKDGAVRMLFTTDADGISECSVHVRRLTPSSYNLHVEPNFLHIGLGIIENGLGRTLKSLRMPPEAQRSSTQAVELELRVVGTTLIAKVNGVEAVRLDDKTLPQGHLDIRLAPGALLHAVQTLDLSKGSTPTVPVLIKGAEVASDAAGAPKGTAVPGAPAPATGEAAFRALFDGKTLAGWSAYGGAAPSAAWRAQDGAVMVTGDRSWLVTKEVFSDFELRLDWKVGPNGNGGIFFRMPGGEGSRPLTAPEFQLCARDVSDAFKTGTLYNVLRLPDDASLPNGEWNTARLVVRGSRCEHWVNEKLVLSYDLKSEEWKKHWQASSFAKDPRFAQATEGWIALQGWTGDVAYRNIRIRPLPTAP